MSVSAVHPSVLAAASIHASSPTAKASGSTTASFSFSTPAGSLGSFVEGKQVKTAPLKTNAPESLAVTFKVSAGQLPAGLSLDSATGVISGIPTSAGEAKFTISASTFTFENATRNYTITIKPPGSTPTPPAGGGTVVPTQGSSTITESIPKEINLVVYDTVKLPLDISSTASKLTVMATGLPTGLSIDDNGVISGTVMAQENRSYSAIISGRDSQGSSFSMPVTFNVLAHHFPNWKNTPITVVNEDVP